MRIERLAANSSITTHAEFTDSSTTSDLTPTEAPLPVVSTGGGIRIGRLRRRRVGFGLR